MKISGRNIIDAIVARLDEEDVRCYDSAIIARLEKLTPEEIQQLTSFGDVTRWRNDRASASLPNTAVSDAERRSL